MRRCEAARMAGAAYGMQKPTEHYHESYRDRSGRGDRLRKIDAREAAAGGLQGRDVATICHDYYYKAHPELTYEERTKLNYDHPQAFDTQMMVDHIKALKENVPIEHPVYSFVEHDRMPETVLVKPSKVIIVDGILIFENKELRDLMDIKVYVDTDADIRLARRILRDVCERGRTMQSVISQYTTTVKPMHEEFVEPSKKYADVIIPEGGFNSVAVAMLIQSIRSLIDNGE